ncbi:MAG: 6-phosphogluconolactonase [Mariprofundaceae bacterium]|nr:6-phosphogluconolactonase [Mariprofundaceae bacterium]
MKNKMHVVSCFNAESVATSVADEVVKAAAVAIAKRGVFHLALAGGTTPKVCYQHLQKSAIDWQHVHVWFGDERCLSVGDSERNDVMADEALLQHIDIPAEQIHRMKSELGPEESALIYERELEVIPCLDLVLLGMGEDGHTASLFPNNAALCDERLVVPVFDAPKPPSQRVSLGYRAIKAAHQRIMMVTGEAKRDAFTRVCGGEDLPILIENSQWFSSL